MKILLWQLFLGFLQWVGYHIGGKRGLLIAFVLVLFWTLTQTYGGLLVLQILIQSLIAFLLFKFYKK